jgi:hypothetical protein
MKLNKMIRVRYLIGKVHLLNLMVINFCIKNQIKNQFKEDKVDT